MAKKCYALTVDGKKVRLRLTVAGQRLLRERYEQDIMQTVLDAASDGEKLAALLEAALNWKDSGNPILDGEELYDLLVDEGWSGQERFGGLALDIAGASGLFSAGQVERMKASIAQAVEEAFQSLEEAADKA